MKEAINQKKKPSQQKDQSNSWWVQIIFFLILWFVSWAAGFFLQLTDSKVMEGLINGCVFFTELSIFLGYGFFSQFKRSISIYYGIRLMMFWQLSKQSYRECMSVSLYYAYHLIIYLLQNYLMKETPLTEEQRRKKSPTEMHHQYNIANMKLTLISFTITSIAMLTLITTINCTTATEDCYYSWIQMINVFTVVGYTLYQLIHYDLQEQQKLLIKNLQINLWIIVIGFIVGHYLSSSSLLKSSQLFCHILILTFLIIRIYIGAHTSQYNTFDRDIFIFCSINHHVIHEYQPNYNNKNSSIMLRYLNKTCYLIIQLLFYLSFYVFITSQSFLYFITAILLLIYFKKKETSLLEDYLSNFLSFSALLQVVFCSQFTRFMLPLIFLACSHIMELISFSLLSPNDYNIFSKVRSTHDYFYGCSDELINNKWIIASNMSCFFSSFLTILSLSYQKLKANKFVNKAFKYQLLIFPLIIFYFVYSCECLTIYSLTLQLCLFLFYAKTYQYFESKSANRQTNKLQ